MDVFGWFEKDFGSIDWFLGGLVGFWLDLYFRINTSKLSKPDVVLKSRGILPYQEVKGLGPKIWL